MKAFVVLAVCIAAASAAPSYGGYSAPEPVRMVKTTYEAPVVKSSYEAPAVRTSYGSYDSTLEVRKPIIPIVKFDLEDDHAGAFNYDTLSGDGTRMQKTGTLKDLGDKEGPVQVMRGSYSYLGTDGKPYQVTWTADENGFHAEGDHLPTPPPVPAEIAAALKTLPVRSSYDSYSYSAPTRSEYVAPVVRVDPAPIVRTSYSAPVRSAY